MSLDSEQLEALTWGSHALHKPDLPYQTKAVKSILAMSMQTHRELDYELELQVENLQLIDWQANNHLLPETPEEKAYGVNAVIRKKLLVVIDQASIRASSISDDGQIIMNLPIGASSNG